MPSSDDTDRPRRTPRPARRPTRAKSPAAKARDARRAADHAAERAPPAESRPTPTGRRVPKAGSARTIASSGQSRRDGEARARAAASGAAGQQGPHKAGTGDRTAQRRKSGAPPRDGEAGHGPARAQTRPPRASASPGRPASPPPARGDSTPPRDSDRPAPRARNRAQAPDAGSRHSPERRETSERRPLARRPASARTAGSAPERSAPRRGAGRNAPKPASPAAPVAPGQGERIAKLLARAGVASRREIERMIAEGRVAIAGAPVETPATILKSLAGVTVDGRPVAAPEPTRLFLFHKPVGLLTTERDPKGRATIYDRLPQDLPRVMPVGRLDLSTEGLLLLTTDGEFKRQLELPRTGVERRYRARAYGTISQAQLEELSEGIEVEGVRYGSIDANLERRTGANVWIELRLAEGKNREVRRVLEYLGLSVSRLIRTAYGPFVLADLPPGAVVEVRQHDLVAFRKTLKP